MRVGIGDARPEPDVGGDDGHVVLGRDPQVVGIAEAGDVVADDRAGRARGVEHRRAPGVDRERHVEAGVQRLDRGHDAVELLVLVDLGPGAGLHAADVEQVGAVGDELLGPAHERVEIPGCAAVVERIGGAVQDPHHHDPRADVDRALTQPEASGTARRRARRQATEAPAASTEVRPSAPRPSIRNGIAAPDVRDGGDPRDQQPRSVAARADRAAARRRRPRRRRSRTRRAARPRARRRGSRPA